MRFYRPPAPVRRLFTAAKFRMETGEKRLCLTFDDGPHPVSTPQLLDILDSAKVKALFFCTGRAANKYPHLINDIRARGHIIGNHGYSHLNGWITSLKRYCDDVDKGSLFTSSELFRPPYGRIGFRQYIRLRKKYRIILWDLMAYDFDPDFSAERSLDILKSKIRCGSIIVLHDSQESNCRFYLQEFLQFQLKEGYSFITDI